MKAVVDWTGVVELVNEDGASVDGGDGDRAEGPDDGDNAYGDYFHTETTNDDVGVAQALKAHNDIQRIGFENSVHDLKVYYKVNEAADGTESGVNVTHAYQSSTTAAAPHPRSWVNSEENVCVAAQEVLVIEEKEGTCCNSMVDN